MAKIRLAMIGCGGNSSGHARRMNANPDVQIVGTCDVNTDIANGYIDRNLSDLSPRPGCIPRHWHYAERNNPGCSGNFYAAYTPF